MDKLVHRPLKIPGKKIIVTKRMIEDAIRQTKSQTQAAKWIGVAYNTYKKYAKLYDLWEQHKNQEGRGIKKGWGAYNIPLDDIFSGKYRSTYYTKTRFKKRLIEEGYLYEECSICSWNEQRATDGKICLNLDYCDGNNDNKSIENLRLLCPNCYLSNNGFFHSSKNFCK
tara:strand:+ start:1112 stop:1618 length:507 start_codon:yes stop_codon:yes gene_type:complete